MISLNFISEALLGAAFILIAGTVVAAIYRQENLNSRFRMALVLYAIGMISVAISLMAPLFMPIINGQPAEFIIKFGAAGIILAAGFITWPLIRLAAQHTRLLASLSETQLLLLERDDLAAAKTKLEKQIIKGAYQFERANRRMRLALSGSPITIFYQDRDHRYTWVLNPPEQTRESDFAGKTDDEVFPSDVALTLAEIKNAAIQTHDEQSVEVRVRFPHGAFWYLFRAQPDYDENDQIIGIVSCAVDITDQKRQQHRLELLMREVTHRSKNILAVLQSIVRQTAIRTKDIDTFVRQLTARLQSIAKSHDLLVNDDWSGTSLKQLLQSQLSYIEGIGSERVQIQGEDILLTAVAVQNLGLAFHELETNAMKYGALSCSDGRIEVDWAIIEGENGIGSSNEGEKRLRLDWRETGGPSVDVGEDSGFGRMLLEHVVGQALGGAVTLDFAPSGLHCMMTLPVSRVIAHEEDHKDTLISQGSRTLQ